MNVKVASDAVYVNVASEYAGTGSVTTDVVREDNAVDVVSKNVP